MFKRVFILITVIGLTAWSCKTTSPKSNLASTPAESNPEFQANAVRAASQTAEIAATRTMLDATKLASTNPITNQVSPETHRKYQTQYQSYIKSAYSAGIATGAVGGAAAGVISWKNREFLLRELTALINYLNNAGKAVSQYSSRKLDQSSTKISAIPGKIKEISAPLLQNISTQSKNSLVNTATFVSTTLNNSSIASNKALEAFLQSLGNSINNSSQLSSDAIQALRTELARSFKTSAEVSQAISFALAPYLEWSGQTFNTVMKAISAFPRASSQYSSNKIVAFRLFLAKVVWRSYLRSIFFLDAVSKSLQSSGAWSSTQLDKAYAAIVSALVSINTSSRNFSAAARSAIINSLKATKAFSSQTIPAIADAVMGAIVTSSERSSALSNKIAEMVWPYVAKSAEVSSRVAKSVLNVIYQSAVVSGRVSSYLFNIVKPLLVSSGQNSSRIVQSSLTVSLEPFKSSFDLFKNTFSGIYKAVANLVVPPALLAARVSAKGWQKFKESMAASYQAYLSSKEQSLNAWVKFKVASAPFRQYLSAKFKLSSQKINELGALIVKSVGDSSRNSKDFVLNCFKSGR